ncbi:hypothetical protein [Neorhizobium sp. NCHU2750]|uniref:hypothetical protein n=1 Tax=Neorhizobium sp. NCHU2750 TaxID=1825976 RepID=UPI000E74CA24|nr:hypothetical protein NCHU2750_36070 [Neorhizobium sp. NCHU2750]
MRITAAFLILSSSTFASALLPAVGTLAGQGAGKMGGGGVSGPRCAVEAAAYSEVADLALTYRDGDDLFGDALYDLREQLLDCLASLEKPSEDDTLPSAEAVRSI